MRALLVVVTLLAAACSTPPLPIHEGCHCVACQEVVPCDSALCEGALEITFLGAAGFYLRRGDDRLLLGPFFSNPSFLDLLFDIESDTELIERELGRLDGIEATQAILVGHAHYDHLMDVPYIAREITPSARLYGSETMKNLLWPDETLRDRLEPLDERAWSEGETEQWIEVAGSHIRFLAIDSEHAPHVDGITFLKGDQPGPRETLPRRGSDWKLGLTLAYRIDFLDADGRPAYRLHYQDSASEPPNGLPPDHGEIDVLLPCVASHMNVEPYPEALLERTAPRHAVLGHWEDFFRPWTHDADELNPVPLTNVHDFVNVMEEEGRAFTLPAPRSRVLYARCR